MIEDIYSLSPLQEGMYYHWLRVPESPIYFEQMSCSLEGEPDIALIGESYQQLVTRHGLLRTFFTTDFGDRPLQVVMKEAASVFEYLNVMNDADFSIAAFKESDRKRGFDLQKGTQARLTLIHLDENKYELIWSQHHILMDGWCIGLLVKEFFSIYDALVQGTEANLYKIYPYSDYIKWLQAVDQESSLSYWRNYLAGYTNVSSLPQIISASEKKGESSEISFSINKNTLNSIRRLCSSLKVTDNTFIQTIWGILLSRYNDKNDVVFGTVVSGRPAGLNGVENMIGLFINTVPVRISFGNDTPLTELLKRTQSSFIDGIDHHYTQLANIQAGSMLGEGLFNHLLVFENYPVQTILKQERGAADSLEIRSVDIFEQTHYDFTIIVVPGDEMIIRFQYNCDIYPEQIVLNIKKHFLRLIEEALDHTDHAASGLDYLGSEEKAHLLKDFNVTVMDYPQDKTLLDLFAEQALKNPDDIALVFKQENLTYRELDERSNQFSRYLTERYKICTEDIAAIILERSNWMVVAILGVLKSGSAYVPVDPEYPEERINYILSDSNCKAVIDRDVVIHFEQNIESYDRKGLPIRSLPTHLAYVIYTSGSTGQPKGVMIEHKSIVNLCFWHNHKFSVTASDRATVYAGVAFDAVVWEIFPYLLSGACLFIVPVEIRTDTIALTNFYDHHHITISFLPTPAAEQFLKEENHSLRYLLIGGDKLNKYAKKVYQVVNNYGPTECTVVATSFNLDKDYTNIPIGKPISNTQIYILSEDNELVAEGVAGEISIGGNRAGPRIYEQSGADIKEIYSSSFY